jgi:hypothetical protein
MVLLRKIRGVLAFIAILLMIGIAYVGVHLFLIIGPAVLLAWIIYMSTRPEPKQKE